MTLCRWQDGKSEVLASLGNRYVMFVQVSPDQKWVSLVTLWKENEHSDGKWQLFAYNIESKKLYAVSDDCGGGACFTGPNRLAYPETDRGAHGDTLTTGQIAEVKLDESAEQLERTPLVDVLPRETAFIQPTGDGFLFTTTPREFPAKTINIAERPTGLYHYTRANGGVAAMAESTHSLFLPSPDGKRILYLHIIPKTEKMPERRELCVMNANGSDQHVLSDVTMYGQQLPMWPTWHGNEQITFIAPGALDVPAAEGNEPRVAFDVVLFNISPQGALEAVKTLSQDWPIEMKPSMKKSASVESFAPTK
jgi:hypothetical protein